MRNCHPATCPPCGSSVRWWELDMTARCRLPVGHNGHHYDGLWWFDGSGLRVDGTAREWKPSSQCPGECPECAGCSGVKRCRSTASARTVTAPLRGHRQTERGERSDGGYSVVFVRSQQCCAQQR